MPPSLLPQSISQTALLVLLQVLEVSATPLLDLQAVPNATQDWRKGSLSSFVGLHSVTITEAAWVDPPPSINYVKKYPAISDDTGGNAVGVVAINCAYSELYVSGSKRNSKWSSDCNVVTYILIRSAQQSEFCFARRIFSAKI